ncbi:hypothetical protein [Acidisoma sp. C75]
MGKHLLDRDLWSFGVTRLFGNHDLGESGLISGWAGPEDGHVWNDGPEALMHAVFEPTNRPVTLTIEGIPFLGGTIPFQDLTLYVNGARLGFWRLSQPKVCTIEAIIEPEHIFLRQGYSVLSCAFHMPGATRPVEIGLGSDTRALAFCFHSICLA